MLCFNSDAIERKFKICNRVACLRTLWMDSVIKAARSLDIMRIIRSIKSTSNWIRKMMNHIENMLNMPFRCTADLQYCVRIWTWTVKWMSFAALSYIYYIHVYVHLQLTRWIPKAEFWPGHKGWISANKFQILVNWLMNYIWGWAIQS